MGPTSATNTKVTARICSGTISQCARKTPEVTSSSGFGSGGGGGGGTPGPRWGGTIAGLHPCGGSGGWGWGGA
ncbi:hypothetical protein GCM10027590_30140 [Nocardiopsis nanhaiensis]